MTFPSAQNSYQCILYFLKVFLLLSYQFFHTVGVIVELNFSKMEHSRRISSIIFSQTVVPPRKRTKPMAVLYLGAPHSATESLAVALQKLGYTTYHGWDVVYEQPSRLRQWTLLADQK